MDGEMRSHARTLTHTQMRVSCSMQTIVCGITVFLYDNRKKILRRSMYAMKWYLYM